MKMKNWFSLLIITAFFLILAIKVDAQKDDSLSDVKSSPTPNEISDRNRPTSQSSQSSSTERKETLAERKEGKEKGTCIERFRQSEYSVFNEKRTENVTKNQCERMEKNARDLYGPTDHYYDAHFEPASTTTNGTTENCTLPNVKNKYKKLPKIE